MYLFLSPCEKINFRRVGGWLGLVLPFLFALLCDRFQVLRGISSTENFLLSWVLNNTFCLKTMKQKSHGCRADTRTHLAYSNNWYLRLFNMCGSPPYGRHEILEASFLMFGMWMCGSSNHLGPRGKCGIGTHTKVQGLEDQGAAKPASDHHFWM